MEAHDNQVNPVFVVGVVRSGTTLMSSMLSAHPAIAIGPDLHYIYGWVRQCRNLDLSRPLDFDRFWRAFSRNSRFEYLGVDPSDVREHIDANQAFSFRGVYSSTLEVYASSLGKRRWGEKTPDTANYLDTLFEWFPGALVVYMLRDPRAVVSSLRKTPWGAASGVHIHARSWADGVSRALQRDGDPRVLRVHYEDLVHHPGEELQKVCRFIGEPYSPEMIVGRQSLTTSALRHREGWEKEHVAAALQPVHEDSIGRWSSELTPRELDVIEHYCGPVMTRAGYTRVGNRLAVGMRAKLFIESSAQLATKRLERSDAAQTWRRLRRRVSALTSG